MASGDGPHSNGSQFYVTLAPMPWMDGKRVVFGKVVRGLRTLRYAPSHTCVCLSVCARYVSLKEVSEVTSQIRGPNRSRARLFVCRIIEKLETINQRPTKPVVVVGCGVYNSAVHKGETPE